jgi:hypothetical protein
LFVICALAPLALAAPELTGRPVPGEARSVLLEILTQAKLASAKVTSTTRTAAEQAKVMFEFVNTSGYEAALDLYGPHGDAIIAVCKKSYSEHQKCVDSVLPKMIEQARFQLKLLEKQGDKRTELMHTSDTHYTIDIAPNSISDRTRFEEAVQEHPRVHRFLKPPLDRDSYHLEIPKS